MVGLRGVGKTVLLDRIREEAEAAGIHTLFVEAPEDRSLPAMLAPRLREALLKLSRHDRARDLAQRALRGLAGFAGALKMKYEDIEVGLDLAPEPGLADNGDLEQDLAELLMAAGTAAREAETALSLFVDELQYVDEDELASCRNGASMPGTPPTRRPSTSATSSERPGPPPPRSTRASSGFASTG